VLNSSGVDVSVDLNGDVKVDVNSDGDVLRITSPSPSPSTIPSTTTSTSFPLRRAAMLALQAVTPEALAAGLAAQAGAAAPTLAEARKVVAAVHRGEPVERVRGVRRVSLDAVQGAGAVPTLQVLAVERSALDPFLKLALATAEGHVIEAVRIPLERPGRFSVCVSSQAGCALGCTFCATGRLGLARNLEAWEIVEQVRLVRATLDGTSPAPPERGRNLAKAGANGRPHIHGVVFQGMGEPLANLDRVIDAIRVLCDPCALAIDARAMTVCTSGLPAGIRRLAKELPKVRLGVSIASARGEVRRGLMPITAAHPLEEVIDAVEEHARVTGLAPMWAVTPLAGVNDTDDDARALAELVHTFALRTGIRPRLSVVPYNSIGENGADPFARGDVRGFFDLLASHGVRSHMRYSGGSDVAAACGQLAGRSDK
jgi:23S rRNA (adenine2503-C2)-methyltransferase